VEKLKIIERVKNGESKACLFRERGIPEGTIRCWMKEEKLRSFVDSIVEDVRLQRKKTRLCEHNEVDECLYKWFLYKSVMKECP
jgi:hypothetical protein